MIKRYVFFVIFFAISKIIEANDLKVYPHFFEASILFIGEISHLLSLSILGYIVAVEVIERVTKDMIFPETKDFLKNDVLNGGKTLLHQDIFPEVRSIVECNIMLHLVKHIKDFTEEMSRIIEKKPFLISSKLIDNEFTKERNWSFIHNMHVRYEDKSCLDNAIRCFLNNNSDEGIRILIDLVERKPSYERTLLNGLVLSKNESDWTYAEKLLNKIGEPIHHVRLSYAFWTKGESDKAIAIAEAGLKLAVTKYSGDLFTITKIKNNLAYFYAEKNIKEKEKEAISYSEEAVDFTKKKYEELEDKKEEKIEDYEMYKYEYVRNLDTLGFVKIAYGSEINTIKKGIEICEDARRSGAADDIYFKNINLAQKRLFEIGQT